MKLGKLLDNVGDNTLRFAAAGFASLATILVTGRVLSSPTLMRLEQSMPLLGKLTRPLRAAINQVYDPAGEA